MSSSMFPSAQLRGCHHCIGAAHTVPSLFFALLRAELLQMVARFQSRTSRMRVWILLGVFRRASTLLRRSIRNAWMQVEVTRPIPSLAICFYQLSCWLAEGDRRIKCSSYKLGSAVQSG